MIDIEKAKELELTGFKKELERIESQTLDLIYDPLFDCICTHSEWLARQNIIPWKCAICGDEILLDKNRNDVENFVCDRCKIAHNNKNQVIDKRIVESRTRMFKYLEEQLYDELEDKKKKKR